MKKWFIVGSISIAAVLSSGVLYERFFESRNFRSSFDGVHHKRLLSKSCIDCLQFNRTTDASYPFSGGGRLNFDHLNKIKKQYPELYVVNLKDEAYYLNGNRAGYYGIDIKEGIPRFKNTEKWYNALTHKARRIMDSVPDDINKVEGLFKESEALAVYGIHYIHLDLMRQEFSQEWDFVDRMLEIFETLPKGAWVHFHCAGGKGRTTTAIIMYDIFRNRVNGSVNDVLKHHYCLGGENINNTTVHANGTWTKENLEGRKALIETFYSYMNAEDGYPKMKWTAWLEKHGIPVNFKL